MSTETFEPYGEPLPELGSRTRAPPKVSAILSAVGQYSFWLLVIVIVCARIAYFSPAPSFPPATVLALTSSTPR
jgi:hypothetical protein